MRNKNLIPTSFQCGGQNFDVISVERCNNNCLGISGYGRGVVEIANVFDKDVIQSSSSKVNTFFHELIHVILSNMGESELNNNEKFVCTFAGFLTEAMVTADYMTVHDVNEQQ